MEDKSPLLFWFSLVIAVIIPPSAVFAECVERIVPSSVKRQVMFSDRPEYEHCRQEVGAFRGQTREYLLCLEAEVGAASDHFNGAVDLFNERARLTDRQTGTARAAKELIY